MESDGFGPEAPLLATEWIVEAWDGGTCVVRVVHSPFASTDDWDDHLENIQAGWADYFAILRLYVTHFAGQFASMFQVMGMAASGDEEWSRVLAPLGLQGAAQGELRDAPKDGMALGGYVQSGPSAAHPMQVLLKLDAPAPGMAHLFAMPMGPRMLVAARLYFFGEAAAGIASREESRWQEWMAREFPMGAPAECADGAG